MYVFLNRKQIDQELASLETNIQAHVDRRERGHSNNTEAPKDRASLSPFNLGSYFEAEAPDKARQHPTVSRSRPKFQGS